MRKAHFSGDIADKHLMLWESIGVDKHNCERAIAFVKESFQLRLDRNKV